MVAVVAADVAEAVSAVPCVCGGFYVCGLLSVFVVFAVVADEAL